MPRKSQGSCLVCGKPAAAPVPGKPNSGRFCSHSCCKAFHHVPFDDRFWSKVDKSGECWIWTGARLGKYGETSDERGVLLAHRASWELHFGPIPEGMWVLHNCPSGDNPLCVNPAHLWLGTALDNNLDAIRKGRPNPGNPKIVGELNPTARLTENDVREIRRRAQAGESQRSLAREYGVASVNALVHRRQWKHVK